LRELTAALDDRCGPEDLFAVLSDHSLYPVGLCAHAPDGEETVAAVVMEPAEGVLWVRKGHPCSAPSQRFALG
jgi:hypothetical protein